VLDDLRDPSPWSSFASDEVRASIRREADAGLCLDHDFGSVSGYAVMRRELPVQWPADFELRVRLKGGGATNDVQLKLVDDSGENVWWVNRPNHALPARWSDWRLQRRHFSFAWGPSANRQLARTRHLELAVAAGRDRGRGTVCLARLELHPREPDPATWPEPTIRRSDTATQLDFGRPREFNGIALHWPSTATVRDYDLRLSDDARQWRTVRRVRSRGPASGLDTLFLPESQARHVEVRSIRGKGSPRVELRDAAAWPDLNAVLAEQARALPRGHTVRSWLGEQHHWTLVGVDGGGPRSGLIGEDGQIELGRAGPSLEPAVRVEGGAPVTWADVRVTQTLPDGHLPLPQVHWRHEDFTLDIQAAADGPGPAPELLASYTLRNTGTRTRRFDLLLALRPWQVNPAQQFLSTPGGSAPLGTLAWDGQRLAIDARTTLGFTATPDELRALPFDGGLGLDALATAPPLRRLLDAQRHPSALAVWRFTLAPGATQTIGWAAPLGQGPAPASTRPIGTDALQARLDAAAATWRKRLGQVQVELPPGSGYLAHSLRTALAHMLVSRDGPALQPGTRSYARSWIRDGAMMVAGLLRLGEVATAREFVQWYAGHVYPSGKVPCCVDARGADPVAEHDSHGQFLYAVALVWRHTSDLEFLRRHWTVTQRVVAHIEELRQSERGAANREPARAHLFGLMPPSISHEGYSDRPAYSYWDDFWTLRGLRDAVRMAQALGQGDTARLWSAQHDEFARELSASVRAAVAHHRIDHLPGAADRGDFDPTSSTVVLDPAEARALLPEGLLERTFSRYVHDSRSRARGERAWKDYTPYELRTVGALARLGQAAQAHEMLDFFFLHQRPAGWRQWAEVVLPDPRQPHFLGDMPHAWVASDYVRAVLDLLGHERDEDATIVLGAGWTPEWLEHGVAVSGLGTSRGELHYRLQPEGAQTWTLHLHGPAGAAMRLAWGGSGPLPRALYDGRELAWSGRELALPAAPARIRLSNARSGAPAP
jgi:hypothetical protein